MREPPGTVVLTPEPFDGALPTDRDPIAAPEEPRRSSRVHRLALSLGLGLLVLVGLAAAGLSSLQIPAVSRAALRALLQAAKPFPNATLALGGVRGSWITGLDVTHLRWTRGDTVLVAADTLRVRYAPLALLRRSLVLRDVDVRGAVFTIESSPDTTKRRDAEIRPADLLSGRFWRGMPIRVGRARITRSRFESRSPAGTARAEGIELAARRVSLGGGPASFELDTLGLRFQPPGIAEWCVVKASGSLTPGRLDVRTLRLAGGASDVEGHGTVMLADATQDTLHDAEFELRAHPIALADLAFFMPGTPARGDVEADVRLRGTRLGTLAGTLSARTDSARFGGVELGRSTVRARLAAGRVDYELAVDIARTPIEARGWARPFDLDPSGELTGLVSRLPKQVPGPPWWDDAATRSARVRLALDRGVGRLDARLESGGESIALQGDVISSRTVTMLKGATIATSAAKGAGRPGFSVTLDSLSARLGGTREYRAYGVRIRHWDLAQWSGVASMASDLNVTLDVELAGTTAPSGRATLRLDSSHVAGIPIERGTLEARMAKGAATIEGVLDSRGTSIRLSAAGRPFDPAPRIEVRTLTFEGLDLATWTGVASLDSRMAGSLAGDVQLGRGTLDAQASLSLDASTLHGLPIQQGEARATLQGGRLRVNGTLQVPGGPASVDFSSTPEGGASVLGARAELPLPTLTRWFGLDSLPTSGRATVELDARGTDVRTATASGTLRVAGTIGAARLDSLGAAFHLDRGLLQVDTLVLRSNAAIASGAGRIALFDSTAASTFRMRADVTDVAPLRSFPGLDSLKLDRGSLTAAVAGRAGALRVDAATNLDRLEVSGLRAARIEAKANGVLDSNFRFDRLEGQARVERAAAGGLRAQEMTATVLGRDGSVAFQAGARLPDRSLRAGGTVTWDSAGQRIQLNEAAAEAPSGNWSLARPATIALGRDRITVESLQARSDRGRIDAHGVIDRRGEQDLTVELEGVGLAGMAAWIGRPDLDGALSGSLRLEGPAATPRATGSVSAELRTGAGPAGVLRGKVESHGSRMDVDVSFDPVSGPPVTFSGHMPIELRLAAADGGRAPLLRMGEGDVDLRLRANTVALASLSPLIDPKTASPQRGTLNADLTFGGKARAIAGSGTVSVVDGEVAMPQLGVFYDKIRLRADLDRDRLQLSEGRAESGGGSVDVRGGIRFASLGQIELDLTVQPRRFMAVHTRDQTVVLSGNVKLDGTAAAPEVSGSATIENTEIYLTAAKTTEESGSRSAIQLTEEDYRMLEESFGDVREKSDEPSRLYAASRLDLDVTLGGDTWVRQRVAPRLAVQLEGRFKLTKEPGGEPQLVGRVAPRPGRGYVEEFARQFDFAGGEVRLNGAMKDHDVDIKTVYKVETGSSEDESDAIVHLDLEGRLDQMKLVLSSEPPMDPSEIVSYIVTGKTSQSSPQSSEQASSLAAQVGVSQLAAPLEELAQEKVGLDVVQVRMDGIQGATIVAGRYIGPQLYLGFRQPVSTKDSSTQTTGSSSRTQFEIDYSAYQWLVLNLQGDASRFKSFVRARLAY